MCNPAITYYVLKILKLVGVLGNSIILARRRLTDRYNRLNAPPKISLCYKHKLANSFHGANLPQLTKRELVIYFSSKIYVEL